MKPYLRTDPSDILTSAGIKFRSTARGELEINCPICGHARAAVNSETGLFNCFSCQAGGHITKILQLPKNQVVTRALSDEKPKLSGDKIEHRYRDETGRHIFSVFRQYYTDGKKSIWSYPAPGYNEDDKREMMRRYVYRLPQVLDPIRFDGRVYICEGEKCCDALASHVPCAAVTCNPGGAGKWTDAHSAWFRYVVPADVVILPDNDFQGKAHVELVAASLYRTCPGIKIKIVSLPGLTNKGDVSDWLKTL